MTERVDAAALLDQCRSPAEQERQVAFQTLGRLLYRLLLPRVRDDPRREHLAADSAQEALVVVWQRLSNDQGPAVPASFVSWAARIALNKLLDAQRRLEPVGQARRPRRVALSRQVRLDAAAEADEGRALDDRLPDPTTEDGGALAMTADLRRLILQVGQVAGVSEASKTVLLYGFLADWDDDELAAHLGTSRNNIHVIRCRDLTRVRGDTAFLDHLRSALG